MGTKNATATAQSAVTNSQQAFLQAEEDKMRERFEQMLQKRLAKVADRKKGKLAFESAVSGLKAEVTKLQTQRKELSSQIKALKAKIKAKREELRAK